MTSLGPLGNKQVRVEDFITIQSGSAGAVGTSAVNTVTVNASADGIPPGAYFTFRSPSPLEQEAQNPIHTYHVWYQINRTASGLLGIDPLPRESNNVGIKVISASGDIAAVVASDTVVAIENFFSGKPPIISVSATRSGNDVVITNRTVGPASAQDGTGSRNSVAASTGFGFAVTTPGVRPDIISFTLASTTEGSNATGGSILNLIPFITTSAINSVATFEVSDDPGAICIRCPDGTEFDQGGVGQYLLLNVEPAHDFYVWYNSGSVATIHRIAGITADTDGSLGGLGLVLDSGSDLFNFWFDVSAVPEVTSIRTVADDDGDLAGTFFKIEDTSDEHYVWMSVSAITEVTRIQMPVDAEGMASTAVDASFFQVRTANDAAAGSDFYVWYSVEGLATDPAAGVGVGIEITGVLSSDLAASIATQTATDITGFAFAGSTSFTAVASAATITLTQVEVGPVTPFASSGAAASDVDAGVVVTTLSSGLATSIDPAPSVSGVGVQVVIDRDDTAATVATQTGSAIGACAAVDFGSPSVSTTEVLVTVGTVGPTPNASDNDTGFSISTVTQGVATSVDPAQGGTSIPVAISPNDTAATVTDLLASAMGLANEAGSFTTSVSGLTVCSININEGTSEVGLSNTTGFSISALLAGRNPNSDPVGASTGLEVAASRLSTSAEVCITTASVINADAFFTASVVGNLVEVHSSEGGAVTASAVTASGVGLENVGADFTIIFSNRNPDPDFDKETS